jgi:glutathione S-transferase
MAENLNVEFDLKDVSEDESLKDELIEKGGEKMVPFLVDTERDVSMYESSDIIEYIRENYANSGSGSTEDRPRIHVGGSTCESCEG